MLLFIFIFLTLVIIIHRPCDVNKANPGLLLFASAVGGKFLATRKCIRVSLLFRRSPVLT